MIEHPWLKKYPDHVKWDQEFEGKPLSTLIDETANKVPNNIALDFLGKSFTYGELQDQVNKAAKALQELGVKTGTKVGLFLPNCPHFIVAFFAISKIGGTVESYSPLYSESELKFQAENSDTEIMVTLNLDALYPKMKRVVSETGIRK